MVTQYRGVEQLVARRAHNPKVMWFKSLLRNQKIKQPKGCLIFLSIAKAMVYHRR